jgi:hypothetical protein
MEVTMFRKRWWICATLSMALLLGATACSRQTKIVGTPAQIDQIITRLDVIDQKLAETVDRMVLGFFIAGFLIAMPIAPLISAARRRKYMSILKRCLWGAFLPAIVAVVIGLIFWLWPAAWKSVGIDPLYLKVVDATTNPAQKAVLTADQTQNVLAMRRQTKGYVVGNRGSFVLESPVLLLVSLTVASMLGALLAYIVYRILPNIYTSARRYQKATAARG